MTWVAHDGARYRYRFNYIYWTSACVLKPSAIAREPCGSLSVRLKSMLYNAMQCMAKHHIRAYFSDQVMFATNMQPVNLQELTYSC